jgi:hypothetical protein
MSLGVRFMVRI